MVDTNTCDKCGLIEPTQELVWITAEDFTPRSGEVLKQEAYEKYDALCEPCYYSELETLSANPYEV
jgi:predicted nucleic-acid-binding Zn-ribbon protein